jgi:hypothetical protein
VACLKAPLFFALFHRSEMAVKQVLTLKAYNIRTLDINNSEVEAEQVGSNGKTCDLCSVGTWFESRRGY